MDANEKSRQNKLIINFLEWPLGEGATDEYEFYEVFGEIADQRLPEEMLFDISWDWLMPVIGKISSECEEPEELDGLKYALLCDDIDTAFIFVVDYLENNNL